MAKSYNGYPSWNAWNVSLWINNDEGLYRMAQAIYKESGGSKRRAAAMLAARLRDIRTPDGTKYTQSAIYGAMDGYTL